MKAHAPITILQQSYWVSANPNHGVLLTGCLQVLAMKCYWPAYCLAAFRNLLPCVLKPIALLLTELKPREAGLLVMDAGWLACGKGPPSEVPQEEAWCSMHHI